jgi:hypothetical protein
MSEILSDDDIKRHREAAQRDLRGRSFIGATVLALIERLEAAERERDEWCGAFAQQTQALDAALAERDALAAKEQTR